MIHVLYEGNVQAEEPVKSLDVKGLKTVRVKLPTGRYYHLLADSDEALDAWVREHTPKPDEPKA